ncbi:hypothetical protein TW80_10225 [Loktanella sp. S4079]|nr:hypothetical protein TW80_10225 [Loktanella sp. S4079]
MEQFHGPLVAEFSVGQGRFKPVLGFRDQVGMLMQKKVTDPNILHEDAFNMVSSAFDGNDW